jgi:hypothetical protein
MESCRRRRVALRPPGPRPASTTQIDPGQPLFFSADTRAQPDKPAPITPRSTCFKTLESAFQSISLVEKGQQRTLCNDACRGHRLLNLSSTPDHIRKHFDDSTNEDSLSQRLALEDKGVWPGRASSQLNRSGFQRRDETSHAVTPMKSGASATIPQRDSMLIQHDHCDQSPCRH